MPHHTGAAGATVSSRPSASRRLLTAKAAAKGNIALTQGEALEDSFPTLPPAAEPAGLQTGETTGTVLAADATNAAPATVAVTPPPASGSLSLPALAPPQQPDSAVAAAPAWSDEDEVALQAMLARRKVAGFQRRGRNVSRQLLCVGDITPAAQTVAAVIVGLVEATGRIARGDLLAAMAGATFPHPKARPKDPSWCQGYVAGGIRDGYLAAAPAACGETEQ
jgi:hypothetical protein